jgi:hypothetical protein
MALTNERNALARQAGRLRNAPIDVLVDGRAGESIYGERRWAQMMRAADRRTYGW